jgi:hypothetical protein
MENDVNTSSKVWERKLEVVNAMIKRWMIHPYLIGN